MRGEMEANVDHLPFSHITLQPFPKCQEFYKKKIASSFLSISLISTEIYKFLLILLFPTPSKTIGWIVLKSLGCTGCKPINVKGICMKSRRQRLDSWKKYHPQDRFLNNVGKAIQND